MSLWVNIQFAMKAPGMARELGLNGVAAQYLLSYIQPFGTLWFIYLLAIFFVATKLLQVVPKPVVLVGAALLHVLAPHTGWLVVDEFADRFVFFYTGYAAAPLVLALAARIWNYPALLLVPALAAWGYLNWLAVDSGVAVAAWSDLPFAYAGVLAVIATSVLLARSGRGPAGSPIAAATRSSSTLHSPLFMGPTRVLLLKLAAAVARRRHGAGDDRCWSAGCTLPVLAGSQHALPLPVRQAKDHGVDHQPAARDVASGLRGARPPRMHTLGLTALCDRPEDS